MKMNWVIVPALFGALACQPPIQLSWGDRVEACGPEPTRADAEDAIKQWTGTCSINPSTAILKNIKVSGRGAILMRDNTIEWKYGWLVEFEINSDEGFGFHGFKTQKLIWNRGRIYSRGIAYGNPNGEPVLLT